MGRTFPSFPATLINDYLIRDDWGRVSNKSRVCIFFIANLSGLWPITAQIITAGLTGSLGYWLSVEQ